VNFWFWRQEEDKRISAPTMTGIMNGAYYVRNSHNPSSRTPRQEWDIKVSEINENKAKEKKNSHNPSSRTPRQE
jgi:hypothetical protein